MIKIAIGFDNGVISPYNVAQHSINMRASEPVSFTPINIKHLTKIFTREKSSTHSTELLSLKILIDPTSRLIW